MLNAPLLRKTLEHVTAHPEEHDQREWVVRSPSCGTVGCIAYHLAVMDGDLHADFGDSATREYEIGLGIIDKVGRYVGTVWGIAQERAGLTQDQADRLFDATNTVHDAWALAHEFSGGEIVPPIEFTA